MRDAPTPPHALSRLAVAMAVVALAAALAGVLAWHLHDRSMIWAHVADLELYHGSYLAMRDGWLPYRDFRMEYPPLAAVVYLLPGLVPGWRDDGTTPPYAAAFGAAMIALAVAAVLVAGRVRAAMRAPPFGAAASSAVVCVAIVLLAPVALFRFDLLPTLLAVLALWAAARRRPATAGAMLALGALVKLFPIVLAPAFLVFFLADGRRAATRFVVGGIVATLAVVVPATAIAPNWPQMFLGYHLGRGLQIESLPSSVYLVAARLGLVDASVYEDHGAHSVNGPGAATVASLAPIATFASLACVYAVAAVRFRRAATIESLALASLLAVLAFATFNKVLSPQYAVWLAPLLGLVDRRVAWPLLIACGLTTALFPFQYTALVQSQSGGSIATLALRNALFATAFVIGLRRLARGPAGSAGQ